MFVSGWDPDESVQCGRSELPRDLRSERRGAVLWDDSSEQRKADSVLFGVHQNVLSPMSRVQSLFVFSLLSLNRIGLDPAMGSSASLTASLVPTPTS